MAEDRALKELLASYTTDNKDFWSFSKRALRYHSHVFYQYPGMMVPGMQTALLQAAKAADCSVGSVVDPFVGSGTVLTEAMSLGLDFFGRDINPLAVLVCRTKAIPHHCDALHEKTRRIISAAKNDRGRTIDAKFPGLFKWFSRDVAISLSRIRQAIRGEEQIWARRFFWTALAETVRLTSNCRTSTFKLHIRPPEELANRTPHPQQLFQEVCRRNLTHLAEQRRFLAARGLLRSGRYIRAAKVTLGNTADVANERECATPFDLLLTSPPYGDNDSTVTYGQHSYLPLRWIDLPDIDPQLDETWLRSTHEIDSRSLGGSKKLQPGDAEALATASPSLRKTLVALAEAPRDRRHRIIAFCRDLSRCINPILNTLRPRALMIWIVGNRKVGGVQIPLDRIIRELFERYGASHACTVRRRIPTKRSACRNNISGTLQHETVLIMRKNSPITPCEK